VYRPLAGCAVLPRYADHLLRTPAYAAEYQRRSTGVNSSRLRLYPEQFLTIAVVVPPHNEQAAIVRFLEWADGQLERAIRTKRKLIVLLNEQKRAIIHHAVTRGLSHVGSLKDSGLDWIGKVPAHWNIVRCGQLFREVVDTGHPEAGLLSIDRFRGIIRQSETGRKERASEDRSAYKRIRPGELAYNLMNAFMGSIGISDLDSILSPAYAVAKPIREMTPAYFHHLFRTRLYTTQFDRYSYGIMYERNRLYFDRFKTIPALVPPLDEQARIVDYIADSTGRVDAAIDIRKRQIMLLQEYGNNLMSEAVTGKLDVRGLELPAIDEPELLGDLGQVEELEDSEPDEKVGLVEETADADN
jgi:type I restriction enzyme S subunit